MAYEYKTVGGPERGRKSREARTVADRVAAAMQDLIAAQAIDGWEYMRTDLVAVEERRGLFSRRQTLHCAVLVFRRPSPGTAPEATAAEPVMRREAPGAGAAPQPGAEPLVLGSTAGRRIDTPPAPSEGPVELGTSIGRRVDTPDDAPAAQGGRDGQPRTLYLRRSGRHGEER